MHAHACHTCMKHTHTQSHKDMCACNRQRTRRHLPPAAASLPPPHPGLTLKPCWHGFWQQLTRQGEQQRHAPQPMQPAAAAPVPAAAASAAAAPAAVATLCGSGRRPCCASWLSSVGAAGAATPHSSIGRFRDLPYFLILGTAFRRTRNCIVPPPPTAFARV